jgi:hypothetical protein
VIDERPPPERNHAFWHSIVRIIEVTKMPFEDYFQRREREAAERGEREGLLPCIEYCLEYKFGAEGVAFMRELEQKADLELLRRFIKAIPRTSSIDDLRPLLP